MKYIFFSFIILSLSACKDASNNSINGSIQIIRFEKLLFDTSGDNFHQAIKNLHIEHASFFELYLNNVLGIQLLNKDTSMYYERIHAFINHNDIKSLYKDTWGKLGDFSSFETEIGTAISIIRQHYPHIKEPHVYTFLSALNMASFTSGDYLGIGVDLFLGKDYENYQYSGHPQYLIDDFEPTNLSTWTVKTFLKDQFVFQNADDGSLLDYMVYEGKINYLLSLSLPNKKEYEILSYSKKQIEWCENNEREIWVFFAERSLLYKKDQKAFMKFITDGPNTSGMPSDAPGNIGSWVGLQIVKSYFNNKDDLRTPLFNKERMKSSEFLHKANYKP